MKWVEVTVEATVRRAYMIHMNDEDYETLINGECDPEAEVAHKAFERLRSDTGIYGDIFCDTDYAICTEEGETIVDWDR